MWPFTNPDRESEERAWLRYRDRLAYTMLQQGYRGDPVTVREAYTWANNYVAEARKRTEAARAA